ncbi:hypothetical protein KJ762_06830 [bacterium]|nr:hypothetical protein [bacterium]MBU1064710.1 hypothetical protein [bacterium]MBU1634208.1 hypothetical protein [bacterium]MBU1873301.1 hypothetical protein [bacterium]
MRRFIKIITLLIVFLIFHQPAFSQKKYVPPGTPGGGIDDPNARYGGLALVQSNNGGGVGGFYEWALNSSNHLTANLNIVFVRGKNDYQIYDYNSSYYYNSPVYLDRPNKTRLNFLSFQLGYKRILFTDKLANNFRPFLYCNAGPVIAMDPANVPDWSERMKNIDYYYNGTVHFGAGIDFVTMPKSLISLFIGYEYLNFPNKIDIPSDLPPEEDWDSYYTGRRNFSGIVIKISLGKKF